ATPRLRDHGVGSVLIADGDERDAHLHELIGMRVEVSLGDARSAARLVHQIRLQQPLVDVPAFHPVALVLPQDCERGFALLAAPPTKVLDQVFLRPRLALVGRLQVPPVDLVMSEHELQLAQQHLPDESGVIRAWRRADHGLPLLLELRVDVASIVRIRVDRIELVHDVPGGDGETVHRRRWCVRRLGATGRERAAAKDEEEGPFHEGSRLAVGCSLAGSGGNSSRRISTSPSTSSDGLRTGSWTCRASALYTESLTTRLRR